MLSNNALPTIIARSLVNDDSWPNKTLTVKQQIVQTNAAAKDAVIYALFEDRTYLFSVLQTESDLYVLKDNTTFPVINNVGLPQTNLFVALTKREIEVLRLLSRGVCAKKVASALSISYQTVRTHQKNIYKKLSVNSLLEAVKVFNENFT